MGFVITHEAYIMSLDGLKRQSQYRFRCVFCARFFLISRVVSSAIFIDIEGVLLTVFKKEFRMRDLIKTDKNLPGWMNWLGIALLVVLAISGAVFSYQDLASDAKPACCGSH